MHAIHAIRAPNEGASMPTVFTNGTVFTPSGPREVSVAVDDGRIAAIGDLAEVRRVAGPAAEEVDLDRGLLSPGFIDAHLHPLMGGLERAQCDLGAAASAEECVAEVARSAGARTSSGWVLGGGWSAALFERGLPTRQLLDAVVPDRPVLLRSADRHSAWANTCALRLAGIDARTPDPADGRIERESDGFPSGALHEGAIMLVQDLAPPPTADDLRRGLLVAQEHCFSLGITGWQDALLREQPGGVDALDVYLSALARGELRAKVTGALWWDRAQGLEQIDRLTARRDAAARWGARFRADAVKIMLDGITETYTALLTHPYHDGSGAATDNNGIRFVDPVVLREAVRALDAAGFQVHFHALGDLAVREALDAISALPGPARHRHHLAHIQVVQASDVARFGPLGAIANLQPLWAQNDAQMTELTVPFLDPSLVSRQYVFAELHAAGARLAGGSDWPVSRADPLHGIHVAVNRRAPGSATDAFLPGQSLPLETIWRAYTSGSAYVNRREDTTGSLHIGHAADLVVLDRDPFAGPVSEIAAARVVSTWIDGERVWEAS